MKKLLGHSSTRGYAGRLQAFIGRPSLLHRGSAPRVRVPTRMRPLSSGERPQRYPPRTPGANPSMRSVYASWRGVQNKVGGGNRRDMTPNETLV